MTPDEKIEELRRDMLKTINHVNDFRREYDLLVKDYAMVREAFTFNRNTGKLRLKSE